jgi:hypothetical protein
LVMQGLPQIIELDLSRFVHHPLHRRLSSCAFALVREPQPYPHPTPEFQSRRPVDDGTALMPRKGQRPTDGTADGWCGPPPNHRFGKESESRTIRIDLCELN